MQLICSVGLIQHVSNQIVLKFENLRLHTLKRGASRSSCAERHPDDRFLVPTIVDWQDFPQAVEKKFS